MSPTRKAHTHAISHASLVLSRAKAKMDLDTHTQVESSNVL